MTFDRTRLPEAVHYFESQGLTLKGRGEWRTTACTFHDGSDSMRVNVRSGAHGCAWLAAPKVATCWRITCKRMAWSLSIPPRH